MKKVNLKKDELNKVVTLGVLLEYTDGFLIPKISDLISESEKRVKSELRGELRGDINSSEGRIKHELKEYIDDKLADYTSDIFRRLDKKYQKEKQFKEKVVELFKKHKIGSQTDLAYLEGLVSAS